MFFNKTERKKGHPALALTVGALAVVGAISIVNSSKRWVMDKSKRVAGFVKGMVGTEGDCEYGE